MNIEDVNKMENFERSLTISSDSLEQVNFIKDLNNVLLNHQNNLISLQHKYAQFVTPNTNIQVSTFPAVLIAPLYAFTEKLSNQIKSYDYQSNQITKLSQEQKLTFKVNLACVDLSKDVLRQTKMLNVDVQMKFLGYLRQYAYSLKFSFEAFCKKNNFEEVTQIEDINDSQVIKLV